MTSVNEEVMILNRDARGRVVAKRQRVELVRAYERSGLSGAKFAALAGVNCQTFVAPFRVGVLAGWCFGREAAASLHAKV
jgi:hypothetical protein